MWSATDNVGVTKVELRVNGATVATDTMAPYSFSWDSKTVANGMATLTAVAYDAAGNSTSLCSGLGQRRQRHRHRPTATRLPTPRRQSCRSSARSAASGSIKAKGSVSISASASDNSGTAGITQTLYIDGVLKTTVSGGSLSYGWNVNKVASGAHTILIDAKDAAGNKSSASVQVSK